MRPAAKKSKKKTAFVPRTIFMTALSSASVIPLVACGEVRSSGALTDGGVEGSHRTGDFDVARVGFGPDVGVGLHADVAIVGFGDVNVSVANVGFDGGDAFQEPDVILGVAMVGFDGGPGDAQLGVAVDAFIPDTGIPDVSFVALDAFTHDAPLGVALPAFDGGTGH